MDLSIIPDGWGLEKLILIARDYNYLFYDSYRAIRLGCPKPYPYMINPDEPMDKVLVDLSTEEGKKIYDQTVQQAIDIHKRVLWDN